MPEYFLNYTELNPSTSLPVSLSNSQDASITAKLRNTQVAMSTQCSLAPNFFNVPSDKDIKKQLIELSIKAYPSKCPCPYSGSNCGGRSAWSRAGGYEPYCYESDIQ